MATRYNAKRNRKERRPGRGPVPFLLALVVHVGLFAFLFVGIRWQKTTPIAQAELWLPSMIAESQPEPIPPQRTRHRGDELSSVAA